MRPRHRIAALTLVLLGACATTDLAMNAPTDRALDRHSAAEPARVRITHVDLDLELDFAAMVMRGTATLQLDRSDPAAPLQLDAATELVIEAVHGTDGTARAVSRAEPDRILGSPLRIELRPGDTELSILYRTGQGAKALQWLRPEQTAGGVEPFLFSQGEAILTRSWIPLQDTPSVRQTYRATIRTPGNTRLVAVMSADQREVVEPGVTRFSMSHPIPSYLIALAVGDLARREISDRCAVWAEPSVVGAAAAEFEDVGMMLETCERLYGPYRWGRYDVLVLPPSFPFGGMENPCLTFATPTILTGDKSLVALIAHELAHSWSGNLVTNATWNDFWLNEGFTVYVEQRIVEALFGVERARMETAIGVQGLDREIATLPAEDQRLVLELDGRDPDDGMSAIAYDKGAAFLRRIEQVFGRARFDRFLRAWFDGHAFQSASTAEFTRFLRTELFDAEPQQAALIDLQEWLHGTGLPADLPRPTTAAFTTIDAQASAFLDGGDATALGAGSWGTMQWLHFLNGLPDATPPARLAALDAAYGLSASFNSEVFTAWLERNLRAGYPSMPPALDVRMEAFLTQVGRRKFVEPIYRALATSPDGLRRARAIYAVARPRYHAVTAGTIDALLGTGD